MNILQEIAQRTRKRIEEQKKIISSEKMKELASLENSDFNFSFEKALQSEEMSFICEIKKASPSKGVIAKEFPYIEIAKEYEMAGVAAISVLTEPHYFKGDNKYLREIADTVSIPLLRKDFTVDSYMIYEAKTLGASAVLLICSLLEEDTLAEYIQIAHSLGMSALVETHNEKEVDMALESGARVIGVNNRNLKTFEVDITRSHILRKRVPQNISFISESGIKEPEDIKNLREIGVNGVLIGESLMKSRDKKVEIRRLRGEIYGSS